MLAYVRCSKRPLGCAEAHVSNGSVSFSGSQQIPITELCMPNNATACPSVDAGLVVLALYRGLSVDVFLQEGG
jgi:hypothetical protein